MTITFTPTDADGDADVLGVHEDLTPRVSPVDKELGWRMSLENLARLVESGQSS